MIGTLLNIFSILLGGAVGVLFGRRLSSRIVETITAVLGTITIALGVQMATQTKSILIILVSLVIGGIVGELTNIERALDRFGQKLETALLRDGKPGMFAKGFITTSLLFCVGPLAIIGPLQDGLTGDYRILTIKSVLDGVTALVFASTMGVGVLCSAVSVLILQGVISFGAQFFGKILTSGVINELVATGGILLILLGLKILDIKPTRIANLLPALIFAPLLMFLMTHFGISLSF